ncbi:hypothetical protein EG329_008581 [Mollisiaceae sp. DMI_Dod_QoI]|nr:hypothetical protein EG329_008581 [Helotiales sp. DMI_Dod_QoI]
MGPTKVNAPYVVATRNTGNTVPGKHKSNGRGANLYQEQEHGILNALNESPGDPIYLDGICIYSGNGRPARGRTFERRVGGPRNRSDYGRLSRSCSRSRSRNRTPTRIVTPVRASSRSNWGHLWDSGGKGHDLLQSPNYGRLSPPRVESISPLERRRQGSTFRQNDIKQEKATA